MNQERWTRIKEVFARAREMTEPERDLYINARALEDPELGQEVRQLLQTGRGAEGFLDPPELARLERPLRRLSFDFEGFLLGDFELIREIGRGASGVVYLGKQLSLSRDVAIKILAPHLCHSDERRERFRREALAASRIRHPNIVSVLSSGEMSGVSYIVMEYVSGRSLYVALEEARSGSHATETAPSAPRVSDPREAARIAEAVARGLAACHSAGVLHRDVKPHNILLDNQRQPRLVDFGLAKDKGLASLSDAGSLSGTPQYMSPEQAQARGDAIDARSDVYSVGAVLYEMLTLKPPFSSANTTEVLQQIVRDRPVDVRRLVPSVPRQLAMTCMRALSRSPEDRHVNAESLADELRAFLDGRVVIPSLRSVLGWRASTISHEHPWALSAVMAAALLWLGPTGRSEIEAAPRDAGPEGHTPPAIHGDALPPQSRDSWAARQRIRDLEGLLLPVPVHTDIDKR